MLEAINAGKTVKRKKTGVCYRLNEKGEPCYFYKASKLIRITAWMEDEKSGKDYEIVEGNQQ